MGKSYLGGEDSRRDDFGVYVAPDGTFSVQRPAVPDPSFDLSYRPHDQEVGFFTPSSLHLAPPKGTVERFRTRILATEQKCCVDARTKTRFSGFRAYPRKNLKVGMSGTLLQRTGGWHALAHQKVTVYFQANHSSRWVKRAVLAVNDRGAFAKTFKESRLGIWRVVFATAPGFWSSETTHEA
ncbi:hypothetical protein J4573_25275 [Actinomadura barringtoniae]|uniref:Uncharacterized protein n=1 Tax=Actinomadura barringtoniae TaxID=1427535 RepID=A0A939PJQ1_9ACTN|nr:hypothetical protein [Actinomadura barringtoniae]MBO2450439.1 hypothetical protein [Actinomadura barringtoniae]